MSEPAREEPGRQTLVAVEPDLAEHILDLLDVAGVAAELRPSNDPSLLAITVTAEEIERATATLDLVLPGLLAEERGELIDEPPRSGLSGRLIRREDWPADESPEQVQPNESRPEDRRRLLDGRTAFAESVLGEGAGTQQHSHGDDGDEFVPPEPPPLPRGDGTTRLAWLGAIGGPILMLLSALLGLGSFFAGAGLAAFVTGFGILVARMKDRAPQDDGWDDGAVL